MPFFKKSLLSDKVCSSIPSIPTILQSLIGEVSQAPEKVDLNRVVELIGRDKSIAAQCLRRANSPPMGQGTCTDSVRGEGCTLGISHIRDIAVSTMTMQVSGAQKGMDPVVFWDIPWDARSSAENSQELSGLKIPKKLISGGYCTIWDLSSTWFCFRSKKRQRSIARCRRANLLARWNPNSSVSRTPEW